jgi:hypothetical protein
MKPDLAHEITDCKLRAVGRNRNKPAREGVYRELTRLLDLLRTRRDYSSEVR